MKCSSCGYVNDGATVACNLCGAVLPSLADGMATPNQPTPAAVMALRLERDREEKHRDLRGGERLRSHAIAGALTFFLLSFILGLPMSLMLENLLWNVALSATFGLPIGYLISLRGGGLVQGAALSAIAFTVMHAIGQLPMVVLGQTMAGALIVGIKWSLLAGALPGGLIGLHVEMDK